MKKTFETLTATTLFSTIALSSLNISLQGNEPALISLGDKKTSQVQETKTDIIPWDISLETIAGKKEAISNWKGYVILIVNTATECGFSSQLDELEELYQKYKERKFIVLAFPSNDFLHQEPGSNQEIEERCRVMYDITYPLFSKISVKGSSIHPLFAWLTDKSIHGKLGGSIMWNYTKFIIDREGRLVDRFSPLTSPTNKQVEKLIETLLSSPEKSDT